MWLYQIDGLGYKSTFKNFIGNQFKMIRIISCLKKDN